MATIGLEGFYVAKYAEVNGKLTYTAAKKTAKAIKVDITSNVKSASLYADNALDDEVSVISDMQIKFTPNDVDEDILGLMGINKSTIDINGTQAEVYAVGGDNEGAYLGFAYITQKRESGTPKYMAKLISKVKFKPNESESYETQGENITFNTQEITGTAYKDCNGFFVYQNFYDTKAAAIAAINGWLGIGTTEEGGNA